MTFPNIFTQPTVTALTERINSLNPNTTATWGKMSVAQMLAHCNVTYEMALENIHPEPNFFVKFMLKTFVKKYLVGAAPYNQNSQTAPAFIIKETKDFDVQKNRLINYLQKTQQLGEAHFSNKKSLSFGILNTNEWNTMFYKHLNHHLTQFNV